MEQDGDAAQNFSKLKELIVSLGTKRVQEHVLQNLAGSLKELLNEKKSVFDELLSSGTISKRQHSLLYPQDDEEPDEDGIEITLWVVVIPHVPVGGERTDRIRRLSETDVGWDDDSLRLRNIYEVLSSDIRPAADGNDGAHSDYMLQRNGLMAVLIRLGIPMNDIEDRLEGDRCHTDGTQQVDKTWMTPGGLTACIN